MTTPISGVGSTVGSSAPAGFAGMSGTDFLKVMIAQLQQQDPMDPAKSDQLLTQLSQIRSLEANDTMTQTLQGLTLQQSIGAASSLIGKTVQGVTSGGDNTTGTVTSVKVMNKQVYLELDNGQTLQLESLTAITPTPVPTALPSGSVVAGNSGTAAVTP